MLIVIPDPPPSLLFGIIWPVVPGVKSSGPFSPTRYVCHPFTGHHFARAEKSGFNQRAFWIVKFE